MTERYLIQFRRATSEWWTLNNPVLGKGEPGFEIDTLLLKIGNGVLEWNDLGYTVPDNVVTDEELASAISSINTSIANAVPTGTILEFGGASAPTGYLLCDGGSFSQTSFPALASVLGDTYGTHSGDTYYLPDFRGRMALGAGTGAGDGASGNAGSKPTGTALTARTRGQWGGAQSVALSEGQLPSHSHSASSSQASHGHTVNDPTHAHYTWNDWRTAYGNNYNTGSAGDGRGNLTSYSGTGIYLSDSQPSITTSIGNTGSNQAHENMTPFVVVNRIIKT